MDLERSGDNLRTTAAPLPPTRDPVPEGVFRSGELGSTLTVASFGGMPHAAFDGFLGRGAMERMLPLGGDAWLLACRRAMDAPAPWDWTLRVERDASGRAAAVTLGCWLARRLRFERLGP